MPSIKPKLIAFDLDYTLWPYWVDTHIDFPVKTKGDKVVDKNGRKVSFYKEVPDILRELQSEGYILAVASRTSEIQGANQLLSLFNWEKYFTHKQIYPGCKVTHFKKLQELTGLPFSEMLFFDDEERNKRDLNKIGVYTEMVRDGVNKKVVKKGLEMFEQQWK